MDLLREGIDNKYVLATTLTKKFIHRQSHTNLHGYIKFGWISLLNDKLLAAETAN